MLRPFRIALEIIASLVGVVVLLGVFLVWRLNARPLHSELLTHTIESGIESLVPGTHVSIAHTLLAWDNVDHSVALHAADVHVIDRNGTAIADVPTLDIQLSAIGMLFGQFLPTEMTVDHPQFRLERQNGSFTFGGVSTGNAAPADSGDDENLKDSVARVAHHLTHALFTHKLQISHAVFYIHDSASGGDWAVSIPEIALKRSGRNLTGQATIDVTQKDRISTIYTDYTYDRAQDLHRLVTRFNDITPALFAGDHTGTSGLALAAIVNIPLTGEMALAFDSNMNVAAGALQLHGGAGSFDDLALWDRPRSVKSLDMKATYDRETNALNVPSVTVDFGGPRLSLSATGTPSTSSAKMAIEVSTQIDNWPMEQYGQLWPKPVIPGARDWIAANLSKGSFTHGEATFKSVLDFDNLDSTTVTEGSGKLSASGARVTYVDGMPPVDGVNADATFDLTQMTARISSGGIGDIKIVPFAIAITGFEDDVQNISIPLKVTGPIPSIMKLIDQPPLGYARAVGLSPDAISGQADAEVSFHFPLLKTLAMKDIGVTGTANLSNVASSQLVHGVAITQGNLALTLNTDNFEIKGPATINAIPLQVMWQQSFSESSGKPLRQAVVTGAVSADQWKTLGIDAFNGTHGSMDVNLQMTQATRTKTLFSGTIDMVNADVRIEQLNWKKAAHAPAAVTFAAEKDGNEDIEITSIEARGPQMNIKGKATLAGDDGQLMSLDLNPMIVGRTNASLHFLRPDDNNDTGGALHFDASGEALDISGLSGGKEPASSQPQPKEFHIKVGKLYTGANGFIAKAEGYAIRDPKGWSEINLHGLADGNHAIDVKLTVRQDGGRDFSITCGDFGEALKGLGFTDTVRGGTLDIHGSSDPEDPRAIIGKADIGSFTVKDLPMLAVLMNAASPFGFAGLFTDSMDFDHVRGSFRWEGDTIKLIGIRAAGASVGLNADGTVNMDTNEANLHGTMVPFSVMNGIIGSIPLIGDLFTGGEGQGIFAVSYSIKGPTGNPQINVNPISLLTPGFIRNLFFGGGDEAADKAPASP